MAASAISPEAGVTTYLRLVKSTPPKRIPIAGIMMSFTRDVTMAVNIRALQRDYLNTVIAKVDDCAKGAAIATQTTYDKAPTSHPYDNLVNNETGLESLKEIFDELGIDDNGDYTKTFGSSDIGNVSFRCPTFHPTLQLVERGIPIHTREFEAAVKTPKAHEMIALGANVIALQCAKIFSDEERIKKLKADFENK